MSSFNDNAMDNGVEKYRILNTCRELELTNEEKTKQVKEMETKYKELQNEMKIEYEKSAMLKDLEKAKRDQLNTLRSSIVNKQLTLDALRQLQNQKADKKKSILHRLNKAYNSLEKNYKESVKLFDKLPVAIKLRESQVEVQKVKIDIAIIKNKRDELKKQEILKNEINKRLQQLEIIKFARTYVKYQTFLLKKDNIHFEDVVNEKNLSKEIISYDEEHRNSGLEKEFLQLPIMSPDDSFDIGGNEMGLINNNFTLHEDKKKKTEPKLSKSFGINDVFNKFKSLWGMIENSKKDDNKTSEQANENQKYGANVAPPKKVAFNLQPDKTPEKKATTKRSFDEDVTKMKPNHPTLKRTKSFNESQTGCTQILAEMGVNDKNENKISTVKIQNVKNVEKHFKNPDTPKPMPTSRPNTKSPYFDATLTQSQLNNSQNNKKNPDHVDQADPNILKNIENKMDKPTMNDSIISEEYEEKSMTSTNSNINSGNEMPNFAGLPINLDMIPGGEAFYAEYDFMTGSDENYANSETYAMSPVISPPEEYEPHMDNESNSGQNKDGEIKTMFDLFPSRNSAANQNTGTSGSLFSMQINSAQTENKPKNKFDFFNF